jgi:hypothetical protein
VHWLSVEETESGKCPCQNVADHAEACRESFTKFLSILLNLGYGAFSVQMSGPFSWWPFIAGLYDHMPLVDMYLETWYEQEHQVRSPPSFDVFQEKLGKVILQLFEQSQENAVKAGRETAEGDAHWGFQQCLLQKYFEKEEDWEKKLEEKEAKVEEEIRHDRYYSDPDDPDSPFLVVRREWYRSIQKIRAPVIHARRIESIIIR